MNIFNSAGSYRLRIAFVPLILIIFAAGLCQVSAQERQKRIQTIRRLESQVNSQIAANDKEELAAPIFRNELVLNTNEHPWPVVGIYKSVIRFYYTFSGKEGEPYPNKLLKITVATQRSDRSEAAEYLFDEAGQLAFCLVKNEADGPAWLRYYFAGRRLIMFSRDQESKHRFTAAQLTAARESQAQALQLKGIFSAAN